MTWRLVPVCDDHALRSCMDIGTESQLEILSPMDHHKRAATPHLAFFLTNPPFSPIFPQLCSPSSMAVIRQNTSTSQHSNDITAETKRTSSDHSMSKETYEVDPACEVVENSGPSDDDYPDGGLRAWLIVAGVSFDNIYISRNLIQSPRRYVMLLRRKYIRSLRHFLCQVRLLFLISH